MIDKIVQMILQEAKKRNSANLEVQIDIVLFEVIDRICNVINAIKKDRLNNL